jgi:hypothetical protein
VRLTCVLGILPARSRSAEPIPSFMGNRTRDTMMASAFTSQLQHKEVRNVLLAKACP